MSPLRPQTMSGAPESIPSAEESLTAAMRSLTQVQSILASQTPYEILPGRNEITTSEQLVALARKFSGDLSERDISLLANRSAMFVIQDVRICDDRTQAALRSFLGVHCWSWRYPDCISLVDCRIGKNIDLSNVNFSYARLCGNFTDLQFQGTDFSHSQLVDANFSKACCTNARFYHCTAL